MQPGYYEIVIDIIENHFTEDDKNHLLRYLKPTTTRIFSKINDLERLEKKLSKRIKKIEDQF